MNEDYFCEDCGQILAEDETIVTAIGHFCADCLGDDEDAVSDNQAP